MADTHAQTDNLARFEVLPLGRSQEEAAELPCPVRITITCSPKHGPDRSVEVARCMRELGHEVTIHLAARMVRDRDHLDLLLAEMAEIGVDDAFVIGGDAPHVHGDYASAVELLPHIAEHPQRPRTVGIAAYPEGHPAIDEATLADALRRKAPLADYVTTQLCFEPEPLLDWVRAARAGGLELPVIVGLPGVVDRRRLMEISMRIGVGPSLRFLRKQHGFFRRMLGRSGPAGEKLLDSLVTCLGDPELGIAGFHYYTFNKLVDTYGWAREHRARGGYVATTSLSRQKEEGATNGPEELGGATAGDRQRRRDGAQFADRPVRLPGSTG
jgi:methylenetetrahydrofolate reductase (NADPH)